METATMIIPTRKKHSMGTCTFYNKRLCAFMDGGGREDSMISPLLVLALAKVPFGF